MKKVTKTYKFTINYPEWLYRFRYDSIKKFINWIFHRPKCLCCGKKLNYKHPNVTHVFNNNQRLIVHWFSESPNKYFCKDCLAVEVEKNTIKPSFGEDFYDYDIAPVCSLNACSNPSFKAFKITVNGINVDFRLCTSSWNHDKVCLSCVKETLSKGKESSSYLGNYKGKPVPLNEFGLPVFEGKVRFPW